MAFQTHFPLLIREGVGAFVKGLMRPEIIHYLLKITVELAGILGIALDEGK